MSQTTNNFLSLETAKESHKNFLIFLLIVLLPLICFSNSLLGDFVYDDLVIVKDNPNLKTLSDIPKLFLQPYWGENNNEGLYRPLAHVTYAINFAISKDDTYSYHLVNIFIHIVSSLLIYWLSNHYCKSKYIALLCSLFFAVHPVHCEAVAAIYGRPELLATFFLLLAWFGFAKGKTNNLWYAFSLINYFLSLLCKESGIVFVGVLLLVQICTETSWKEKLRPDPKLLGYIFTTIPYLAIRVYVTKVIGIPKGGQFLGRETFLTRVYTMSLGYLEYFRMLIWPDKLYTEYTFDVIPRATSPNIVVIFAMLVIFSLVIIGILQINKKPASSYAILFFFVTTSIVSNIFIPTGVLIAERTIYFPVASVCLLLALILYQIHKIGWQKTSIGLAIVLIALASVRTYYRNFDFKDNFALFGSVLKLVPNHFKMTSAIAGIYEERGELLEAEKYYKKLIEIAPRYTQAYSALANLYVSQGFDNKALPLLEKAIEISPSSANAYVPLGRIYLKQKNFPKAIEAFQKASSLIIPNAKLQHELALAIFYSGDLELAEKEMNKAIKLDPYFVEPKINLAKVLQKQNKIDQAQSLLDEALTLDPNDLDIYITYGSILKTKNDLCRAKDYLLKALSANSQLSEAHYQLGLVYADMNLYNEAKRELELHLKLTPSNSDARKKLFELNKNTKTEPAIKCP
jgi:tetratricopeptide (TPR) repeat protein